MFRAAVQCKISHLPRILQRGRHQRKKAERRKHNAQQQERHSQIIKNNNHIAGFSHQPWTGFSLLSSLCPSWLHVVVFPKLFVFFLLCAASKSRFKGAEGGPKESARRREGEREGAEPGRSVTLSESKWLLVCSGL